MSTYVPGVEEPFLDDEPETFSGPDPWGVWSGTSFAAPQVAGAVALIMEQQGVDARTALARLLASGIPVPGRGSGAADHGRQPVLSRPCRGRPVRR